jgi:hypothetical protein
LKLRPLLRALALSVFPLAIVIVLPNAPSGCGQDVATCDAACPVLTGCTSNCPSINCSSECSSAQQQCEASNDPSDFQALLTCVTNANGYLDPLPLACVPQANAVKANCTGVAPQPDAGQ